MTPLVSLPAELTIYTAAETRSAFLAALDALADADGAEAAVVADGAAVDTVDACGVQLLVALSRSLASRQRPFHVAQASGPLRDGCEALGLATLLDAPLTAGAAA